MASTNEKFKITSVLFKSMNFKDKYTTEAKIKADTSGKEKDKTIINNDTYAFCEVLEGIKGEIKAILRAGIK